jgi:hypothetical protein
MQGTTDACASTTAHTYWGSHGAQQWPLFAYEQLEHSALADFTPECLTARFAREKQSGTK